MLDFSTTGPMLINFDLKSGTHLGERQEHLLRFLGKLMQLGNRATLSTDVQELSMNLSKNKAGLDQCYAKSPTVQTSSAVLGGV